MTQKFKPYLSLFLLPLLLSSTAGGTLNPGATPDVLPEADVELETQTDVFETNEEYIEDLVPAASLWHNYPNVCETFSVVEGAKAVKSKRGTDYPLRYKRNRYDRKKSDQDRTKELVKMVVREMGGDADAQRIVSTIAMHESSWNPEAIHILNPDRNANQQAWLRYTYHPTTEKVLERSLENMSAQNSKYWGTKGRLADIRLYKGNSFWDDQIEYTHTIPAREYRGQVTPSESWKDHSSVWTFGYGLFGMNAVLFTHIWDRTAPPWILCGDEGIPAIVTAVWALRKDQAECAHLSKENPDKYGTDGGSARGVVRRFAKGSCSNVKLGKSWTRIMEQGRVDWDGVPNFGTKFQRYETISKGKKRHFKKDENGRKIPTDRMAILEHMRKKAQEEGLLREEPLQRKNPHTAPVIIRNSAP